MKRFLALFVFSLISAFAAPVGNPASPEWIEKGFFIPEDWWWNVRIGYEGDFVSDGKMEQYSEGYGRVDSYEQETNSGTVTFNFWDRVDLFAVLGSTRENADWRFVNSGNVYRIEMETNYDFLWGLGIRGILYVDEGIVVGMGGRYERTSSTPSWLTSNGVPQSVAHSELTWREWQINADVSYQIDIFNPYLGVKYSNARAELSGFAEAISEKGVGSNHFKNRVPIGVFIGCGLSSSKYFLLNVEGRLIDETAITVSGDIRF